MKITPELAEIAGIHAGDGYLRYEGSRKELDISGGYEEKDYYDNHVIPLFNKEFGLSIKGRFFPSRRTYGFRTYNSKPIEKLASLEFPSGKKSLTVKVPKLIYLSKDKKIICSFIRGYFDTDGCFTFFNRKGGKYYSEFKKKYNYYPRIILRSVSKELIYQLFDLLKKMSFKCYICKKKIKIKNWNDAYELYLVGRSNLIKWMILIGTKNPCKLSRYLIWEEFGFCPTNLTYDQRINILEGKLNPYSLY